ncbi:amidohydrolase family protein [Ruania alkalisoli]|uniref:Amidohydrolase family protein n=1 Tax=Ruania alkalisoli TaxID=2779775 RepID=A0A7M1SQN0_9MICO|nr:amidohydrolase [Ruania alkalisoli]QOR69304.1 amidohydrolase family protein [Ruania alkalisoli]
MADLLLRNIRPWGGESVDLTIAGDRITDVAPTGTSAPVREVTGTGEASSAVVDGRGLLALPGFINAHAHVDKSWWGQPWQPYGGVATTQGRIEHERARREELGIPNVESTVAVLREFLRHGTTAVRTHVDVDLGVGLRGIETVRVAAEQLGGGIDLDVVAFPQDGVVRRPGVMELLDRAAAEGADRIGGIDPCTIDRDPVAQLDGLFDIAERRGVGLDIHLHDGGELGGFQYDLIVERVRRSGLYGKVTISHGFALGDLAPARQADLLAELAELGISWTTVAPVGSAPLPWQQMRDLDVALGLGTDGIRDLWSPFGDGDMLRIALAFARLHRLRTDEDLRYAAELAGVRAAGFVGREERDLVPGARADVVLVDAENVPDALVRVPRRELVVAGGNVVVREGALL